MRDPGDPHRPRSGPRPVAGRRRPAADGFPEASRRVYEHAPSGGVKKRKRKSIPYGTKLAVKLTLRERDLIVDETFCDSGFAKLAVVDVAEIRVELPLEDIEEIQGSVAAAANPMKKSQLRQELDRLFEKLQVFLDTYDDQKE